MYDDDHPLFLGLAGFARSGKDTVAGILVREHGFHHVKFSTILKQMLYRLDPIVGAYTDPEDPFSWTEMPLGDMVDTFGWDWAKDNAPQVRTMLQTLGTEAGRDLLGPDVWVDATIRNLPSPVAGAAARFVFSDVRFPNEAACMNRLWHVIRPGFGPVNDHSSEAMPGTPEAIIHNTGTIEDLYPIVQEVLHDAPAT